MNTTWIESALRMGGKLTVEKEGRFYRPRMDWPNGKTVYGHGRMTIAEAIEGLDAVLCDDAADEMMREGAV